MATLSLKNCINLSKDSWMHIIDRLIQNSGDACTIQLTHNMYNIMHNIKNDANKSLIELIVEKG
jgi:hypothetical protein